MWKISFILLLWFQPQMGSAQFGNFMVRSILQGMNNIFGTIGFTFQNLGAAIHDRIQQQLAPLQNLGTEIFQNVQQNLMPIYAMSIKKNMENGFGGVTTAIYEGNHPRYFIIQNGERYVCKGKIVGPRCEGYTMSFHITSREDYCYAKSYAVVNNHICLSDGTLNINVFNDDVDCHSPDNSAVLLLNRNQYYQLCGNRMPWQALFTYYANPNDPNAIPIPNPNPYVKCLNNEAGVCVFRGTEGSGNGDTFVSNHHMNYYSY